MPSPHRPHARTGVRTYWQGIRQKAWGRQDGWFLHPHVTDKGAVKSVRRFLANAGVLP